jgi:hypothetical protein
VGDLDPVDAGAKLEGVDVEVLAASLCASSSDLAMFVDVLAAALEQALPGRVTVVRRATRFLAKTKRVERFQCDFGEERYLLAVREGSVETRRAKAVRGVVLKTEELPLEQWLEGVARSLAAEAQTSERARFALEQLLAGH